MKYKLIIVHMDDTLLNCSNQKADRDKDDIRRAEKSVLESP